MTADLIDGARIAAEIRQEVAMGVTDLKSTYGIVPKLGAILVGDDPASAVYVRNKEKAANEAGMLSEVRRFSSDITQEKLLEEAAR